MMDFNNTYQNCVVLFDRSGHEPICFMQKECSIDTLGFLNGKNCTFASTEQSLNQLSYQTQQSSIGGFLAEQTSSGAQHIDYNNFSISKTDGGVVLGSFNNGYPLKIVSINLQKQQTTLWDSYHPFIKSAASDADKSNIYFIRENRYCWLLSNDTDQNESIKLLRGHCLRPVDLLVWMVDDSFIKRQKAVWVYKRMKEKDLAWIPKRVTFAEYFKRVE